MMAYPAHQRLTPPSHHKQQHKQHQQFLDEQQNSPRTITLHNQTDSILRGMTTSMHSQHTAMMLTAERDQLTFRQTSSHQKPYLPSTGQLLASSGSPSSSSRPIRITRRKQNPPHQYAPPAQTSDDAHLSASPSELQHFYDEATWRMYHLIQTARLEKQATKEDATSSATASEDEDLMDNETHFERFFKAVPNRHTPSSLLPSTASVAVPEDDMTVNVMDQEEGVFELDDL